VGPGVRSMFSADALSVDSWPVVRKMDQKSDFAVLLVSGESDVGIWARHRIDWLIHRECSLLDDTGGCSGASRS
jgi:hypothetical protein